MILFTLTLVGISDDSHCFDKALTILEKRKGMREEFPVEDAAHYGRDTMVLECEIAVTMAPLSGS